MNRHASRQHDAAVVELLREDPPFAEASGMANVASCAGIPRESMHRMLSPRANPSLGTLPAPSPAGRKTR